VTNFKADIITKVNHKIFKGLWLKAAGLFLTKNCLNCLVSQESAGFFAQKKWKYGMIKGRDFVRGRCCWWLAEIKRDLRISGYLPCWFWWD